MLGLVGWGACRGEGEVAHDRRVWEMEDHAADLFAARDALGRGDLRAVEDAGLRLAAPDPLPGLPEDALVALEAVRAGGRLVATADDRAAAADVLVSITLSCAACHARMGATAPTSDRSDADRVWLALAFEDEALWAAQGGPAWRDLRAEVAAALAASP